MGLERASIELGFSRCYLATLKSLYRDKFDYIQSLDDNIVFAYRKYEDEYIDIKSKLTEIWFELEEESKLNEFSRFVHSKDIYAGPTVFMSTVPRFLFKVHERIRHSALLSYKKMIEIYPEFLDKSRQY